MLYGETAWLLEPAGSMNRKPPEPQMPDAGLKAIQDQTEQDNLAAQQARLGQQTNDLLRRYGARVALSGAAVSAPLKVS